MITEGHFILDLADANNVNQEIDVEYEVDDDDPDEQKVVLRIIGRIPSSLGLSRGEILHLAEDWFWRHDLLAEHDNNDYDLDYFG
jgi:hypothetical protein